jgi:hypothetical protein
MEIINIFKQSIAKIFDSTTVFVSLRNTTQVIVRHRICLQTDRQTDGHGETSIPPYNFVAGGIMMVKRGGSLSFLVGIIRNVLVMEIGWTDVGSGGYILVSIY